MPVIFVESTVFQRCVADYLDDDGLTLLQQALLHDPLKGVVIPGSGGLRKLRWPKPGGGRRGGLRIIYFVSADAEIWLLTIYAKNEAKDIPLRILRRLKTEMEDG